MSTDLENFLATTSHERPGRILYHASFTEDLRQRVQAHIGEDKNIGAHYGLFGPVAPPIRPPADTPALDYSKYWEGADLPEGARIGGNGVVSVPSGYYHFTGMISPLRNAASLADIEQYPMHDISGWDFSGMKEAVDNAHAQGRVAGGFIGHMYETAWQIRGYEEFLLDTIERPAWAECLLERLAQQNLIRARAYAKAGVDLIQTGDDVANQKALMFSPDSWRQLIHSRWRKVWQEIKSINPNTRIWYHSDGNVSDIIDDQVEAGLDILNPVQPECLDTDAIRARYGRRLTFDGTIGTQSTMPWGTPADVRARVKEVIEKYGKNGGLIIGPTHVLEPEVPIENIEALVDACREYGTFE